VAVRQARVARGTVVARLEACGHRPLAHRLELFLGLVGVVRVARGDELLGDLAVTVQALGLIDRALVVVEPEPAHRLEDGVDRRLRAALAVGVLDAQDELAAAPARHQPAVRGGAGPADLPVAGGAGGEAGAAGGIGHPAILPCMSRRERRSYNRGVATLFISDLHLDPERPAITELFARFVGGEAREADALYILGDLFEAWVGDDDPSETGRLVAETLHALSDSGVPVHFMRGNRDFLL